MMLEKLFHLRERNSSVAIEFRGAVATFLTMAYILVANPAILSGAGIPFGAAVACTALAAGISCLLMGLIANFPLALASGMGLNSMIAFGLVPLLGSWQKAMALVVLDGIVVALLVFAGLREAVLHAIPRNLRLAIGAGIGLFIAFIGFVNARLLTVPGGTLSVLQKSPLATMPPVEFGNFRMPQTWLTFLGVIIIAVLLVKRIRGAVIVGILANTLLALFLGITKLPEKWGAPDFSIAFQADFSSAFTLAAIPLLLSIVMVDFFDTLGTVTAIAEQTKLADKRGKIPGLRNILFVDSIAASIGGMLGVSSVTSYIESAAGVSEGARTGLSTVFVGLLFLLCIFIAPLASVVPSCATSPALIVVGFLMLGHIKEIDYEKIDEALPAFLTLIAIPFTFSISHGIGLGVISYVLIKLLSFKFKDIHPLMYLVAAAFLAHFFLA